MCVCVCVCVCVSGDRHREHSAVSAQVVFMVLHEGVSCVGSTADVHLLEHVTTLQSYGGCRDRKYCDWSVKAACAF